MIAVPLTTDEASRCYDCAQEIIDVKEINHGVRGPFVLESLQAMFFGIMGEFALAKYLNIEHKLFTDYNPFRNDVSIYEVRTTTHANGKLITYKDDKSAPYVLATLDMQKGYTIYLRGWAMLDECNIDENWNTSAKIPSYWTPQHQLHNMTDLPMAVI